MHHSIVENEERAYFKESQFSTRIPSANPAATICHPYPQSGIIETERIERYGLPEMQPG